MSEDARYSLTIDGRQVEVGWDELVQMSRDGRVTPATILTTASGAQVQAQNILGLFDAAPPTPPASPPQSPYNATGQPMPPPAEAPYYASQVNGLPKKSFPVWAIVLIVICACGLGSCLIIPAILFPVFSQARVAAKRAAELANMRQLAMGAMMYSMDFDDKLPLSMASASSAEPFIEPYVRNPSVFAELNPAGGQILGDPRLNGIELSTLASPASVIMFYDERDWAGGAVLASYADGHAKRLVRGDVDSDLATPLAREKSASEQDRQVEKTQPGKRGKR